ncbi:hypothetical protein MXB_4904 [Myxobolus squamalis]|nr:hypothetical protein MXB_4904 [Myxobolus squamalis]
MMFVTPILFSPLYVYMGHLVPKTASWSSYMFGGITAFVFGCLQSVQDRLDDPFLGVTYDEINLDDLHTWANESLKHNANRVDVIGRFTVKSNEKDQVETKEQKAVNQILKDHPYLSALNSASSVKTIRVTKTHELPGRNRVIFVRNLQNPDDHTPSTIS